MEHFEDTSKKRDHTVLYMNPASKKLQTEKLLALTAFLVEFQKRVFRFRAKDSNF